MSLGGQRRHISLAAMLAAALLAPAGCGGSDEDDATQAAEEALTSTDLSVCGDLLTDRYLQQIQLAGGDQGVEACQAELNFSASEAAEAQSIELDGDRATAEIAITGGQFDGQVVTYELAKEGDQWKLDRLVGFAEYDDAAFDRAQDAILEKGKEVNPPGARCYTDVTKELSQQELEALFASGDIREYAQLFSRCN